MKEESVSLIINSSVDYIHFVNDTAEVLVKSKAKFDKEEDSEKFIQDLRILIYELFSNAVSHSQSNNVALRYTLSDKELKIEIETLGEGFMIKTIDEEGIYTERNSPPYKDEILNKDFIVYRDDENIVLSKVTGKYNMELHHVKTGNIGNLTKEVPEHYGLYLITCLSDKVTYKRTTEGKDIFTIVKYIKGENA
jgi:anti-sigma regulatory factor (Ser/Thr protein kinase)